MNVALEPEKTRVTISVKFSGNRLVCPKCSTACSLKENAPERQWRQLDTMQFETVLKAAVPRVHCDACGVKPIAVPWVDRNTGFTLVDGP